MIVKNNECAERKTYQATFDEVPAMFSDGSSTAGTVYIEELKRSEHVRIHFPYISTFIEIIRVSGALKNRMKLPKKFLVINFCKFL